MASFISKDFISYHFILAEKKEEREKQEKQKHKSSSASVAHCQMISNGEHQSNRTANGEAAAAHLSSEETWIHDLFQGTLVSTTKCLNCETVRIVYLISVIF